jgi:hypothetical protein
MLRTLPLLLLAGCIQTLPIPDDFPREVATEAAELAVSAYDLRTVEGDGGTWEAPDGYELLARLTTEQNWNDLDADEPEVVPVGWVGTRDGVAHVVFRGTSTTTEALLDLAIDQVDFLLLSGDGGGTHRGFTERYEELHPQLLDALEPLIESGDVDSIALTGHSLGGSIATLAAAALAEALDVPVQAITLASPRTGDRDFVARYAGLVDDSWRITNPRDLVPGFPDDAPAGSSGTVEQWFYEHVEVRVDLPFDDENGTVERNLGVGGNHGSCRYLQEVCELTEAEESCVARVEAHPSCVE